MFNSEINEFSTFLREAFDDESSNTAALKTLFQPPSHLAVVKHIPNKVSPKFKRAKIENKILTKRERDDADTWEVRQWKRKQYIEKNIPKIVKSDVRRNYMIMLSNACNSHDIGSFSVFLATFCSNNFVQYHITENIHSESFKAGYPVVSLLSGVQNSVQHWYDEMQALPDTVIRLVNTHFHVYSHTQTSKVVGYVELTTTKLYDLEYDLLAPHHVVNNPVDAARNDFMVLDNGCAGNMKIFTGINELIHNAPLLPNPITMKLYSKITLNIDENNFIERMDVEGNQFLCNT